MKFIISALPLTFNTILRYWANQKSNQNISFIDAPSIIEPKKTFIDVELKAISYCYLSALNEALPSIIHIKYKARSVKDWSSVIDIDRKNSGELRIFLEEYISLAEDMYDHDKERQWIRLCESLQTERKIEGTVSSLKNLINMRRVPITRFIMTPIFFVHPELHCSRYLTNAEFLPFLRRFIAESYTCHDANQICPAFYSENHGPYQIISGNVVMLPLPEEPPLSCMGGYFDHTIAHEIAHSFTSNAIPRVRIFNEYNNSDGYFSDEEREAITDLFAFKIMHKHQMLPTTAESLVRRIKWNAVIKNMQYLGRIYRILHYYGSIRNVLDTSLTSLGILPKVRIAKINSSNDLLENIDTRLEEKCAAQGLKVKQLLNLEEVIEIFGGDPSLRQFLGYYYYHT